MTPISRLHTLLPPLCLLFALACADETVVAGADGNNNQEPEYGWLDGENLYEVLSLDSPPIMLARHEGDVIELRQYFPDPESSGTELLIGRVSFADLTPKAVTQIDELSAALLDKIVADGFEPPTQECVEIDGVMWLWLSDTSVVYAAACRPDEVVALDDMLSQIATDLAACQASPHLTPHIDCEIFSE